MDEVHMSLSQEYKNFLLNNSYDRLLCLTATVDDKEKLEFLEALAPVIHTTDINRALTLKLISDFTIYNLTVYLSPESKSAYQAIMNRYEEYERLLGGRLKAFATASMAINQIKQIPVAERTDGQKILYKNACIFWGIMNRRKMFLYNLPEKIQMVAELISMFSERKTIVFAESIKFAQQLKAKLGSSAVIYHSEMSDLHRKQALMYFGSGKSRVRTICAVRALNVGLNVPEASLGICASGNSKWLDQVQRNGRVTRYIEGKRAIYINLFAWNTQEVKWVQSRIKKIRPENVKWVYKKEEIIESEAGE